VTLDRRGRRWGYPTAVAVIAAVTAIGLAAYPRLALEDIAMVYLPAIMIASVAGRGPAILASSLAVLAFDFCFVPPRFTFVIADARHAITFAVMFAAGLTISTLVERLRRQEAETRRVALVARTEELRSSILSSVSHDLRTPLAVITGAATSLRDAPLAPEVRAELLDSVIEEAQRLERVLTNLIGMTRLETGLTPAREWVPAEEVVGGALTRLEERLGDREVKVDVPADLQLHIDPVLFEQALVNLLENALGHGAPPIEVRVAREGDYVVVEVTDHGAGVSATDAARIFEKFYRSSTAAPGVGLGLAVVRGIVEGHGGTVSVDTAAGGGARFRIRLPQVGALTPS
jgi:two-component system, OmpR family, sensor histidine kinase KdpD